MSDYRGRLSDLSPSDREDIESFKPRTCRSCRGLGYLPGNHDRGPVPCDCREAADDDRAD